NTDPHICFSLFYSYYSPTPDIYTLSLHDGLPICYIAPIGKNKSIFAKYIRRTPFNPPVLTSFCQIPVSKIIGLAVTGNGFFIFRSEDHTSELQSRENLVCRLLLEKKKKKIFRITT